MNRNKSPIPGREKTLGFRVQKKTLKLECQWQRDVQHPMRPMITAKAYNTRLAVFLYEADTSLPQRQRDGNRWQMHGRWKMVYLVTERKPAAKGEVLSCTWQHRQCQERRDGQQRNAASDYTIGKQCQPWYVDETDSSLPSEVYLVTERRLAATGC